MAIHQTKIEAGSGKRSMLGIQFWIRRKLQRETVLGNPRKYLVLPPVWWPGAKFGLCPTCRRFGKPAYAVKERCC